MKIPLFYYRSILTTLYLISNLIPIPKSLPTMSASVALSVSCQTPCQTFSLDSPEDPLKTIAEISCQNSPAFLPQPDVTTASERAAAEKAAAENINAIMKLSKQMVSEAMFEFTKGFSQPGVYPSWSKNTWKESCKKAIEDCISLRATTGYYVFLKASLISVRNLAHRCFGKEWPDKCIDLVNTTNKDAVERLYLTPLPKCCPIVPHARSGLVDAVALWARKPVPQASELPWATPGKTLLVFFTDKWLKATFIAKVPSGYKFAFADTTERVVTEADVLWRIMTIDEILYFKYPADKKRRLETVIAETEEMERQNEALKKKTKVFELKIAEQKKMIAQLTAL